MAQISAVAIAVNHETDGKPVVGPTGGTFRRTLEMVKLFRALPEFNMTFTSGRDRREHDLGLR